MKIYRASGYDDNLEVDSCIGYFLHEAVARREMKRATLIAMKPAEREMRNKIVNSHETLTTYQLNTACEPNCVYNLLSIAILNALGEDGHSKVLHHSNLKYLTISEDKDDNGKPIFVEAAFPITQLNLRKLSDEEFDTLWNYLLDTPECRIILTMLLQHFTVFDQCEEIDVIMDEP